MSTQDVAHSGATQMRKPVRVEISSYTVPENVELVGDDTPPIVRKHGKSCVIHWEAPPVYSRVV